MIQRVQRRLSVKISEPYGLGLITHVQPEKEIQLSELFRETNIADFEHLLKFGAVYVDTNRVTDDTLVSETALVRIHRNPKRHPVENVDWSQTIVEENEHFVVINKPYNVPVHATVDNLRENVLFQASQYLKCPLYVTHRLDVETTGLLMLAKTKIFQNVFNYLLQNKHVTKKYKAHSENRPPEGLIRHYLQNGQFSPKLTSIDPIEGWQLCELVVENIKEIKLPNEKPGFESQILLLTGRTHQIRAQMTGLNCPLFGDTLYGNENKEFPLGLKAYHLNFFWPATNQEYTYTI